MTEAGGGVGDLATRPSTKGDECPGELRQEHIAVTSLLTFAKETATCMGSHTSHPRRGWLRPACELMARRVTGSGAIVVAAASSSLVTPYLCSTTRMRCGS
jgi:hypothetical protein